MSSVLLTVIVMVVMLSVTQHAFVCLDCQLNEVVRASTDRGEVNCG